MTKVALIHVYFLKNGLIYQSGFDSIHSLSLGSNICYYFICFICMEDFKILTLFITVNIVVLKNLYIFILIMSTTKAGLLVLMYMSHEKLLPLYILYIVYIYFYITRITVCYFINNYEHEHIIFVTKFKIYT